VYGYSISGPLRSRTSIGAERALCLAKANSGTLYHECRRSRKCHSRLAVPGQSVASLAGTDRVAFFFWLQTEHNNSRLSAVVAPPKENGITWSNCRSFLDEQETHFPPSRFQTKMRVSAGIDGLAICCVRARGSRAGEGRYRRRGARGIQGNLLILQFLQECRDPRSPCSGRES
jgi:hypothetical protein